MIGFDFELAIGDDNSPALLCGECEQPIQVEGQSFTDGLTDVACGCEETPERFTFEQMGYA